MVTKIFQIATYGTFRDDQVLIGLRIFLTHKLALICYDHDNTKAKLFSERLKSSDKNIEVSSYFITKPNTLESVFEYIGRILTIEKNRFQRILVNVSSLSYAVLCAAYIKGIEIFMINSNFSNSEAIIPVLKTCYNKVITKTNLRILNSIARAGGVVYGLDQLQRLSGLIKPLLSYHINGRGNTKGLIDLGLVWLETKKYENGTVAIVRLTAIGKLFITNRK